MDQVNQILSKLNEYTGEGMELSDIMGFSFHQLKELAKDILVWDEITFLHQLARKELKENKITESRILSRANPQLANAIRLGILQSPMQRSYDDLFPQRVSNFVGSDSVASMFSPAAYLTELYREARDLHKDTSPYHLDIRRPDLASLSLSQNNMDDELSTLSLSNELILMNIQSKESKDYDGVMKQLATYRLSGDTPYNQPYEAISQSITLQDPELNTFRNNPAVASKIKDFISLSSCDSSINPELYDILTEDIEYNKNTLIKDSLIKANFGDTPIEIFQNCAYLAQWYGLSYNELSEIINQLMSYDNYVPDILGAQYYHGDFLSYFMEFEGYLKPLLMTRIISNNNSLLYTELLPLSKDKYHFQFAINPLIQIPSVNTKDNDRRVIITAVDSNSNYLINQEEKVDFNKMYGFDLEIEPSSLSDIKFQVSISDSNEPNGFKHTDARFLLTSDDFAYTLLKLNKFIRLYKATGMNISDILNIISSIHYKQEIGKTELDRLLLAKYYMKCYGVDASEAVILSGAHIGQIDRDSQVSVFTRLFNMPLLDNREFFADGKEVELKPGNITDTFRTGVIKRAFGVSDTELYTLWLLVKNSESNTSEDFTCTIDNLSKLYRGKLLADVNGLTITELATLMSVSSYASIPVADQVNGEAKLFIFIETISHYTRWLKEMNWTVGDLYLMLTTHFSTVLSPDIENLVDTLKNSLANQNIDYTVEAGLITAMAPLIAAGTQLDSVEKAEAILQWLAQLKPQELTVADFLELVNNDKRTEIETANMVAYCQVMGQLSLIVRYSCLSASEVAWVVAHPSIFVKNATKLDHNISTVYDLTQLHIFLTRCGAYASEILTSLSGEAESKNNLPIKTVATALELDELALAQALEQSNPTENKYFYNWINLSDALQWLNVAAIFSITPANVAKLIKLTNISLYTDWVNVSHALQSGLNTAQTIQLSAKLDENLSAAAGGYFIKNIAPPWVTNREKIYNWLLIDNQVSAQIKTTRIAEAIASVQLYVNRALTGLEEDVVTEVKGRKFFTSDWDTYNKRYSTWAGVSQLVYYPENYINPTQRIGQTSMMDEMLQSLSQSQLTSDTVEDAFKTYMTRFEEIANLDVISGYHDSISDKSGVSYIIGRSAIGHYYWRSADIDKLSNGKLPANAWSEWKKITAALSPVENLIRPVIFQSRLYIVWVESNDVGEFTEDSSIDKSVRYELKYAHILHDGTWSAPITVTLDNLLPLEGDTSIAITGMYCAKDISRDKLNIYFYKKASSYSYARPDYVVGLKLASDGSVNNISKDDVSVTIDYIYKQFDTLCKINLNSLYIDGTDTYSVSNTEIISKCNGDFDYTYITSDLFVHSVNQVNNNEVKIIFSANGAIYYKGKNKYEIAQFDMINALSGIEDKTYFIPNKVRRSTVAQKSGRDFSCIMLSLDDNANIAQSYVKVLDTIPSIYNDKLYTFYDNSPDTLNQNAHLSNSCKLYYDNNTGIWKPTNQTLTPQDYIYAFMSPDNKSNSPVELSFSDFRKIKTGLDKSNIKVTTEGEDGVSASSLMRSDFYTSWFYFVNKELSIPASRLQHSTQDQYDLLISINVDAHKDDVRKNLGKDIFLVKLFKQTKDNIPLIPLSKTIQGAQYLQYGNDRIRVNTLFAKQLVARANLGLNAILSMETQQLPEPSIKNENEQYGTEFMDFNGANAIYFWEMFYYVPMMVFKRLMDENKFTEATQWIKYIWSPDGYLIDGEPAPYTWNVRPLEEETSWNDDPLDSVDPDAVAQADPMHYKVATFMAWLDLLIARGDAAYRQLERDTLNEAKMWYVQALNILGDEPYIKQDSDWNNPNLSDMVKKSNQKDIQQALMIVREQIDSHELRTANSLTGLFLPQQNEKLTAYWQTLAQRLYNLRHNLSIDGAPLSLSIYAPSADPAALLSAAVNAYSGGLDLPPTMMPLYRFPVILESARNMVSQLSQFGNTLLSITERQDAEAMSDLLQIQGTELILQSIALQDSTISEIEKDKAALEENLSGAQSRLNSYTNLYNENISLNEKKAMDLALSSSVLSNTATTSYTVAAGLDIMPNIYGFAFGGSQYGSIPRAIGYGIEIVAGATRAASENISQLETYRRRRQDWEIQRNATQSEIDQINAQLAALDTRREGAQLQKVYLKTQQSQTQAQMIFLQNKFTNTALYNWLRGKLSAIYYQFYDLTVSRCLMAQEAYKWASGIESASFIRPGAWQGTYAGLMAGETLMLNLTQMDQSWLQKDQREKEVVRTVCLSEVYASLSTTPFTLADEIVTLVTAGKGSVGPVGNGLSVTDDKQLQASLTLSGLKISNDYPSSLGKNRRIKQISVTLPALVGPYQDVRAVLSYDDPRGLAKGCDSLAISHGMNDSGQFQLDFNDGRWLPFEGIPVDSSGVFTLSFPQVDSHQKELLLSLTDIILQIRYTIAS
ncbi:TPA: insecticidal toxin complex protein A [Proteus mirabilis]|nr:insecticidal toxin complex protein A [Proteus mirabilis]HEK2722621.1 insecticidal toxin complex protein A [Proteus mirabilis]